MSSVQRVLCSPQFTVSQKHVNLLSCVFQVCDEPEELKRKATELAAAICSAKHLVIYTGAGISTVGFFGVSGWSCGSFCRAVAVLFRLLLWFPNDCMMRVTSLGCGGSAHTMARTMVSLHPGLMPPAQGVLRLHLPL